MHLRDVELGDVDAYVRMRCDPVMMAELGGPRPREGIQEKVRSDVQDVASGAAWIKMIVPGEDTPDVVAGTVSLYAPSNGICRSLGFRFVEEREVVFAGVVLRANHWVIDPRTDLIGGSVDDLR